jgi:CBS domain-containing protein
MIMTADVATCEPGEDINGALAKMTERGIRYLPVVENGKLTGFIEKPDALEVLYEEAALDFAQLRNYVFKTGGRY